MCSRGCISAISFLSPKFGRRIVTVVIIHFKPLSKHGRTPGTCRTEPPPMVSHWVRRFDWWKSWFRLRGGYSEPWLQLYQQFSYVGVSKNNGTPKSSILIGFSIVNHPFWGTSIYGNTHVLLAYWFWMAMWMLINSRSDCNLNIGHNWRRLLTLLTSLA